MICNEILKIELQINLTPTLTLTINTPSHILFKHIHTIRDSTVTLNKNQAIYLKNMLQAHTIINLLINCLSLVQ